MKLIDRMRALGLLPEPPPPPPPPPPAAVATAHLGTCERMAALVLAGDGVVIVPEADHLAMLAELDLAVFGAVPAVTRARPDVGRGAQRGAA